MKSKLIFIVPSIALVGFLAIKPPAIGGEAGKVIITPDKTITPAAQPNLRDFDDEGRGPDHDDYDHDDEDEDYKKSDIKAGDLAPINGATPGVLPKPIIGGGDDDDDDDEDDDDHEGHHERNGHHDDNHDDDDESDEDDDH